MRAPASLPRTDGCRAWQIVGDNRRLVAPPKPMPTSFRSNVLLLALGQALMLSAIVLSMTLAAHHAGRIGSAAW